MYYFSLITWIQICLDHYKLCVGQLLEPCSFWAICKRTLNFYCDILKWYYDLFRNKRELNIKINKGFVDIGDVILRNTAAGSNSYYFYRTWSEYRQGFGTIDSLYWIGLDKLHDLSQRGCAVLFDLQDPDGTWYYARYSTFLVGDSADYYRLSVGGFTGNVSDALTIYHNNKQFSTYDYGPSLGCGISYYGGWWYDSCCYVCLTLSPSGVFHWNYMRLNVADVRFVCWWNLNMTL